MQILKEMPNGERVRVTDLTHATDCKSPNYRRLVNESKLVIYALQRMTTATLMATVPLHYGGRGRGLKHVSRPWNGA